ncbi:MAG: DUF1674 domain-containing protein [Hyphomicrobiales bacterium]|nr:MAG: DUF1674 domain-containing protein [Hyphomicrobiales bacterium]
MNVKGPKNQISRSTVTHTGKGGFAPAARRALAEAEERRRTGLLNQPAVRKEINGRDGPEPVRYGDWEVKGIASDF